MLDYLDSVMKSISTILPSKGEVGRKERRKKRKKGEGNKEMRGR